MALISSYDVDDRVRLGNHSSNPNTAPFTTVAGVPTDPTTVTLVVKEPDGTLTTYTYPATLSKESTGRFYTDITLDAAGLWSYRLTGTGAVVAVEEGQLHARQRVAA
jgi:hypothetical protein